MRGIILTTKDISLLYKYKCCLDRNVVTVSRCEDDFSYSDFRCNSKFVKEYHFCKVKDSIVPEEVEKELYTKDRFIVKYIIDKFSARKIHEMQTLTERAVEVMTDDEVDTVQFYVHDYCHDTICIARTRAGECVLMSDSKDFLEKLK